MYKEVSTLLYGAQAQWFSISTKGFSRQFVWLVLESHSYESEDDQHEPLWSLDGFIADDGVPEWECG